MELLLSCGPFAVWIQGHPSASFSRNYKRVRSSCFSHTAQNYSIVKYLKATSRNQRTLHFFNHCCQVRHYSFSIKKCGEDDWSICKPLRMPKEEFQSLCHLPDHMIGEDDHYLPFETVFHMKTSEKDRSSLSSRYPFICAYPWSQL